MYKALNHMDYINIKTWHIINMDVLYHRNNRNTNSVKDTY